MSGSGRNTLIICASVLAIAALYFARSVLRPRRYRCLRSPWSGPSEMAQERLPIIALAMALLLTVFVLSALLALSVWGIGQVGRWMIINAAQVQAFYVQLTQWLESHGIASRGKQVTSVFVTARAQQAWVLMNPSPTKSPREGKVNDGMLSSILFIKPNRTRIHAVQAGFCLSRPEQEFIRRKNARREANLGLNRWCVIGHGNHRQAILDRHYTCVLRRYSSAPYARHSTSYRSPRSLG